MFKKTKGKKIRGKSAKKHKGERIWHVGGQRKEQGR